MSKSLWTFQLRTKPICIPGRPKSQYHRALLQNVEFTQQSPAN
jgi:hypothetical protein